MDILIAATYGLVQGITEFLPISSSAHLLLFPWLFHWADPGLAFDVALHWGTLLGVVIYYRKECIDLTRGFFSSLSGGRDPIHLLSWKIILATLPAVVVGFTFEKRIENTMRSPWVTVITLSLGALLLLWADRMVRRGDGQTEISWKQALFIGLAQSVALIPGVSRSGITITTALFLGLARPAAVQFSFLMSIPVIFGAGVLKMNYLLESWNDPFVLTGVAAAAISGFAAISFLVKFVRNQTFRPFVIYRLALAGFIFWRLVK